MGILLVALGVAALMGILALFVGTRSDFFEHAILTALTIGFTSTGFFISAMLVDKRRFLLVGWTGMVSAVVSGLILLILIWWRELVTETFFSLRSDSYYLIDQIDSTAIMIGVGFPLIAALLSPRLTGSARVFQYITDKLVLVTMFIGGLYIWTDYRFAGPIVEIISKTWGVLLILSIAGSITTFALARLAGSKSEAELTEATTKLTISCPRCLIKQDLPVGDSVCRHCRLKFKIEVEEPRCGKCGYILRGLTRPICPECGETFSIEGLAGAVAEPRTPSGDTSQS
ncbi:MAG: hypothetical protein WCI73_02815 [Phycisphaerae bacterium]